MASLRPPCDEIYHIYNEVDHIISYAGSCWEGRTGAPPCRDPLLQPKNIWITVGINKIVTLGLDEPQNGAATPDLAPMMSTPASPASSIFRRSAVREALAETATSLAPSVLLPELDARSASTRSPAAPPAPPAPLLELDGRSASKLSTGPRSPSKQPQSRTPSKRSPSKSAASTALPSGTDPLGAPTTAQTGVAQEMATISLRSETGMERFPLDDFIAMESPYLADLLADQVKLTWNKYERETSLKPISRSPTVFPAVIALLKLRWLGKLQNALVALGGKRASLENVFLGMLVGACVCTSTPRSPMQVYDLITETLQTRLRKSWPLFLSYVANHDLDLSASVMSIPDKWSDASPASAARGASPGSVRPGSRRTSIGGARGTASCSSILDETFLAWIVQQESGKVLAQEVFEELDFFGVQRPEVNNSVEGVRQWQAMMSLPAKPQRVVKKAQQHAHRLAILLELPEIYRSQMRLSLEETLDLARLVVSNPKTFSPTLRARILYNLEGCGFQGANYLRVGTPRLAGTGSQLPSRLPSKTVTPIPESIELRPLVQRPHTAPEGNIGTLSASIPPRGLQSAGGPRVSAVGTELRAALGSSCYSAASAMDEEQSGLLTKYSTHPRDCGRLSNKLLESLRDKTPPILTGRQAIFPSHTENWAAFMKSEMVFPRPREETPWYS